MKIKSLIFTYRAATIRQVAKVKNNKKTNNKHTKNKLEKKKKIPTIKLVFKKDKNNKNTKLATRVWKRFAKTAETTISSLGKAAF